MIPISEEEIARHDIGHGQVGCLIRGSVYCCWNGILVFDGGRWHMYIISKSEERKRREEAVLRTYHYTENAPAQIREYAEGAAEGIHQALKMMGKGEKHESF